VITGADPAFPAAGQGGCLTVDPEQISHLVLTMADMKKTSVGRVESFKTSLTKQKQRLAKQTQIQNQFDKTMIETDLKKKEEEEKSTKALIFGALRKLSGNSRKSSKSDEKKEVIPPKTPPASPIQQRYVGFAPPSPSPSPSLQPKVLDPSVCQQEISRKTPVPSDSPLLKKIQKDPILKRIRSFNKSLKKAHSFRMSREKSTEPVGTAQ